MPRLKKSEQQKRLEAVEQADTALMAMIGKYIILRHTSKPELAAKIQMPESTFYQRCRNPGDWRRCELVQIFAVLQIPEEEKRAVQW